MSTTENKGLNIALWVAQGLLAAMFLMAGFMKTTTPIAELGATLPWVNDFPYLVRFIGISELLGAIGLLLPSILRIQPKLTPLAAWGIVAIMVLASIFHGMKGEFPQIGINVVLGAIAGFVAWGRTTKVPISAK